jgi:hypothetical protein
MTTVVRPGPLPRINILRVIAVYKLLKVLLLLAVAYGEVRPAMPRSAPNY